MTDETNPAGQDDRAERALRNAFGARAGGASSYGLNGSTIRRAARRRSTLRVVGVATAVVAVCGSVVGGVELSRKAADPPSASAPSLIAPAKGWRFEYYRDVRLQVPKSWAYSAEPGPDWCALRRDLPKRPYVARAEDSQVVLRIGCLTRGSTPGSAFSTGPPMRLWVDHVALSSASPSSAGAPSTRRIGPFWVVKQVVGHTGIKVVTTDRNLADRILGSVETVTASSPSCDPHSDVQSRHFERPSPAFDVTSLPSVDSILVCQYSLAGSINEPGLTGQYRLTGAAADRELHALQGAPLGGGPDRPNTCTGGDLGASALALHLEKAGVDHQMYVYYSTCRGNGFDDGTAIRALTTTACRPLIHLPVAIYVGSGPSFSRCAPS